MDARTHQFEAVAFVENFNLRDLSQVIPGGRLRPHELRYRLDAGGEVFVYPFGAAVFHDAAPEHRDRFLERIRSAVPRLGRQVVAESFSVREEPGARTGFADGVLHIGELGAARAAAVAIVVAQSAATEYYERLVEDLFRRTDALVDALEKSGTVRARPARLHRFIGEAVTSRNEVLSVLHLLDKPDEAWDDPLMDRIYDELRAEFDLVDRYQALELKLRSVQEALELVLDVARDRRLVLLEAAIVLLIVFELLLSLLRLH